MKVFNLAEELEKERKKNKELQGNIDVLINSNCQLNEYIEQLEKENKKLNKEIFWLKEENIDKSECIEAFKDMLNKRDTIIDKAIEYIGQETFRYSMCFVDNETGLIDLKRSDFTIKQLSPKKVEKLLDILKGSDNNE